MSYQMVCWDYYFHFYQMEVFMTTHEFDAYCDTQDIIEPDYHEQIIVLQEFEMTREDNLRRLGAIDALQSLAITLSALCLRDDVKGDYYFGMHDALEVVRCDLDLTPLSLDTLFC
jgi:hypothetical protein